MARRPLLIVLVSLLTLLAGCSGGLGDAPGGSNGAGAGDGGDGGSGSGDGDGADARFADREAVLAAAGSYTTTWSYDTRDLDGERGALTVTTRADLVGNRTHVTYAGIDGEDGGWERFQDGATTYARYGSGEDVVYAVSEDGTGSLLAGALGHGGLYGDGDLEGLERAGTETFDGVSVTPYEADGRSLWWAGAGVVGGSEPDAVTSVDVRYVLLVDRDGLVRSEAWSYEVTTNDGRTVSFSWIYEITALGSTTVAEPAWRATADAANER